MWRPLYCHHGAKKISETMVCKQMGSNDQHLEFSALYVECTLYVCDEASSTKCLCSMRAVAFDETNGRSRAVPLSENNVLYR